MGVYLKGVNKEWADRVLTVAGYRQFFKDDEIVEVKELHGRLIDADALPVKDLDSNGWLNAFGVAVEDLENAPTVIEAEDEE